jgi:hypothetical protein
MGIVLSSYPPKHQGELNVYNQLSSQNDDAMYLWFSLDFIPGVNDIDLLLWHEDEGVFVIEIKAIPLSMLVSFSFSSCEIQGRGIDRSPQNQAYDASQSLRNYLEPKLDKIPFMVATVCWPLITRTEWKDRFRDSREISELSESMLMSEDIYSGSKILKKRLKEIWSNPPVRKGSTFAFKHDRDTFIRLKSTLDPQATPRPVGSDISKLEALEKGIKRDLMRSFFPFAQNTAIFEGRPGTGKTFRLQQIAVMHARENAKVLFCCFNQVLASELKRIFNLLDISFRHSGSDIALKENIDVIDISSLAARLCGDLGIKIPPKDFDSWGQLIFEDLRDSDYLSNYPIFDTVLVDESQDFNDWQLGIILLMAKKTSTVVFGIGSGQELYSQEVSTKTLKSKLTESGYKVLNLRRNFRNAKPIYQLAHLVYECAFEAKKISEVYNKTFLHKKAEIQEIEFDINEANYPKIVYVDDDVQSEIDEPTYRKDTTDKLASEYERLILGELLSFDEIIDLLILVPDTVGDEVFCARIALDRIYKSNGIDYLDYVEKNNRKQIAPSGKIRLVTFHSCRGLEGTTVIIFGLEKLASLGRNSGLDPAKLGYIALSRAIFKLVICVRKNRQNKFTEFVSQALAYIQSNFT